MIERRLPALFLIAKWSVTAALLAAMTMPFASCDFNGRTYEVVPRVNNLPSALPFVWPIPLLVVQTTLSLKRRAILAILVTEVLLALCAWLQLSLELAGAALITLGGALAGPGADLAYGCLEGYSALVLLQGVVCVTLRLPPRGLAER